MRFSLENRGIDKENLCCWEKHKKIKKLLLIATGALLKTT